jgi:hypothetical protein
MTWAKWIVAALVVAMVVFALLRRFRRAGGVIAIPSQLRPTGNVVDLPTGNPSTASTPIRNSNATAAEGSE